MLRSIFAIALPIVLWGLFWVGGNQVANGLFASSYVDHIPQSTPLLLMFISFSVILSIAAGFACARLAGRLEMRHVWILAVLQLAIGIMVQMGVADKMPLWYHLIFLGFVVPAHLLGGRIALSRPQVNPLATA